MIRILIETVTVYVRPDSERVRVVIHWRGSTTTEREVLRPLNEYRRLERYTQLREELTQHTPKSSQQAALQIPHGCH